MTPSQLAESSVNSGHVDRATFCLQLHSFTVTFHASPSPSHSSTCSHCLPPTPNLNRSSCSPSSVPPSLASSSATQGTPCGTPDTPSGSSFNPSFVPAPPVPPVPSSGPIRSGCTSPRARRMRASSTASPYNHQIVDFSVPGEDSSRITKPPGEVGRPNWGGYSLQKFLDWPPDKYRKVKAFVTDLVSEHLDCSLCFSKQSIDEIQEIRQKARCDFLGCAIAVPLAITLQ
ncbi:hypothetical protein GYMLUDRAFT_59293 [Collybiopsis luxurians FD-317 M1]|uniref:Uncharacterized protein n=1 Tax=Collybiopsis luxurians FD-317 M1 TaxID=944289 RepID=A0A0D0CPT8_9AGAR|nr:hypothetical protein GYMLUDRAFT_59293 [Collybiopsis luxurians FD-317 M1]